MPRSEGDGRGAGGQQRRQAVLGESRWGKESDDLDEDTAPEWESKGSHRLRQQPGGGQRGVGADHCKDAVLLEAQRLGLDDGRVDEVEPQRVGAILVDELGGRRVVAQALAHLLAVLREDQPVADQVLERRLVEQRRRQHHQRVEPAHTAPHRAPQPPRPRQHFSGAHSHWSGTTGANSRRHRICIITEAPGKQQPGCSRSGGD